MTIYYQNSETGDAWDVTTLCSEAKLKTVRSGSPGSLTAKFLPDEQVVWANGGILTVLAEDGTGIFYGYVFKCVWKEDGVVSVTVYDQLIYLKRNKETYVFEYQTCDAIISQICADFGIATGALESGSYSIPSLVEDGKTLLDICLDAIDYELAYAGKMPFLWDDYGKIRLSSPESLKLDLILGDHSLATGYEYEEEIETETYNRIKLVQDNKETGKRDVYIFEDSGTMKKWGTLQDYEVVAESMSASDIQNRGEQMLQLYNRPKKKFSIDALADLSVRAGYGVCIQISDLGVNAFFIVEECTQDLVKEIMTLTLKVV